MDKTNHACSLDIQTISKDNVLDIKEYRVDKQLPKNDRINNFIHHFSNPYFYKCGEIIVHMEFAQTEKSLEDLLISFLVQKK